MMRKVQVVISIKKGKDIYLDTLSREDCRKLWNDFEYDFTNPTEDLNIGHSDEKAEEWFKDIQEKQGEVNIRLGIFLKDGTVIGDVALQDMSSRHRTCSVGMGIAKISNRSRGYGYQALELILGLGFRYVGMERITAGTLEMNLGAQRILERGGFVLEGRQRSAVYMNGRRWDRLEYAILKEEYAQRAGEHA